MVIKCSNFVLIYVRKWVGDLGGWIGKDGCELVRDEFVMEWNFYIFLFDLLYIIFSIRLFIWNDGI